MNKDKLNRAEYLQLWTANCHHLAVVPISFYILYNSECEGSYPFIFLRDKQCFYTADSGCVKSNFITVGYLAYDFILYKFFMPNNELNWQSTMHHVVGIIGIISGMTVGFGIPCATTIALLSEISTFFLNYRTMYTKEELNQPLPLFCQILFVISYTVIRIFIFPILAYQLILTICVTWPTLSLLR